jgi:hypothetical protein
LLVAPAEICVVTFFGNTSWYPMPAFGVVRIRLQ